MALLKHTSSGPTGTTVEEWDVDPLAFLGLGIVVNGLLGMFLWVRKKIVGR